MFTQFYNESIRKTVVAFGAMFDEIFVVRRNSDGSTNRRFLVPITYAQKEKFIRMLDELPNTKESDNAAAIANILPRIGFSISSMNYDSARKRNTVYKKYKTSSTAKTYDTQFAEVPYTIGFSLAVATRTMDDALQILEQITAYFTPEFTVTLNFTDINAKVDVPFVLNSVTPEIDYLGDTSEQRSIIFNLDFTAYTYVFGPTKQQTYITESTVNALTSFFDEFGGVTGPTGAGVKSIASITGPSGENTLPPSAIAGVTSFFAPETLSITGATQDG